MYDVRCTKVRKLEGLFWLQTGVHRTSNTVHESPKVKTEKIKSINRF